MVRIVMVHDERVIIAKQSELKFFKKRTENRVTFQILIRILFPFPPARHNFLRYS